MTPSTSHNQFHDYEGIVKSAKSRLYQFKLSSYYSPEDLVNESIIRYNKAKEQGKSIPKPDAWLRLTIYNRVRELNRARKKTISLTADVESLAAGGLEQLETEEEYAFLSSALKQISQDKAEILKLHYIEGLSWKKIANSINQSQKETVTPEALRKRAQRALVELREIFSKASVMLLLASLASNSLTAMALRLVEVG